LLAEFLSYGASFTDSGWLPGAGRPWAVAGPDVQRGCRETEKKKAQRKVTMETRDKETEQGTRDE
jgi:hypothetical protein